MKKAGGVLPGFASHLGWTLVGRQVITTWENLTMRNRTGQRNMIGMRLTARVRGQDTIAAAGHRHYAVTDAVRSGNPGSEFTSLVRSPSRLNLLALPGSRKSNPSR
jgi:hypothetical protein